MILRGTNKVKQLIIVTVVRKKPKIYLEYKLSRKKKKEIQKFALPLRIDFMPFRISWLT